MREAKASDRNREMKKGEDRKTEREREKECERVAGFGGEQVWSSTAAQTELKEARGRDSPLWRV